MINERGGGAAGGVRTVDKPKYYGRPVLVQISPPKILRGLTWDQSQQLTTQTMVRPCFVLRYCYILLLQTFAAVTDGPADDIR
jgi:hypothetical protein